MQIITPMRCYLTPVRMKSASNMWVRMWRKGNPPTPYTVDGKVNWYSNYGKLWRLLQKLEKNYHVISNPTPGYISKGNKNKLLKRYLYPMFIVVLYVTIKI